MTKKRSKFTEAQSAFILRQGQEGTPVGEICLKPLTSGQIRAARAFLRWRAEDLARESAVGVATIRRAELTENQTSMTAANDMVIRRALEAAGIEFIDENGGGPGVCLKKRRRPKSTK